MERRIALEQLALVTGSLIALPAWANAWTRTSLPVGKALLTDSQSDLLTRLIDTLIPASDTPGAKDLAVPDFVQRMVADCYEPAIQQNVKDGLAAVDALAQERFNQSFSACDANQRMDVLKAMEQSPEKPRKDVYALIKNLTIQGYTTSEYVMTKFLNYTMIPGHFYGCVPAPVVAK